MGFLLKKQIVDFSTGRAMSCQIYLDKEDSESQPQLFQSYKLTSSTKPWLSPKLGRKPVQQWTQIQDLRVKKQPPPCLCIHRHLINQCRAVNSRPRKTNSSILMLTLNLPLTLTLPPVPQLGLSSPCKRLQRGRRLGASRERLVREAATKAFTFCHHLAGR